MSKPNTNSKQNKQSSHSHASTRPDAAIEDNDVSEEDEDEDEDEDDGLLPVNIDPLNYNIRIIPCYDTWRFKGHVDITLEVKEATNLIQFNAANLRLNNIQFVQNSVSSTPIQVADDAEEEVVTLTFSENFHVGSAHLIIEYDGHINEKLNGLYRSHYTDPSGTSRVILVTQFEACDARRALPCWDEPARKSTFDVQLVAPNNCVALSNMTVKQSAPFNMHAHTQSTIDAHKSYDLSNGWSITSFHTSPQMSTYLLVFVIGQFQHIETKSDNNVLIRVYTPLGKIDQAEFSLQLGARCLTFYERYFQIHYPLPKLDLVAVPDIAITAMENFGCITFGETALLLHPTQSAQSAKQYVSWLVAHEIAHQWFGNLATMEWWNDLWLNEGFASWMEYFCVNALFPDWRMWEQYIIAHHTYTLQLDSFVNTHPVEVDVDSPADIDEVFDGISYSKGSTVIRMLHNYLGDDEFRKGLTSYLKHYSYKNASTNDLWRALDESSGKPVEQLMKQWTLCGNYPYIHVKNIRVDNGKVRMDIAQKRFYIHGNTKKDAALWIIPLSICAAGHKEDIASQSFENESGSFVFDVPNSVQCIKLNAGQIGLYRVLYPQAYYSTLKSSLFSFHVIDRLGIENDLFAFSRAGMMSVVQVLEFIEIFAEQETEYIVIADLANNILEFSSMFKHLPSIYCHIREYFARYFSKILSRIGGIESSSDESHLSTLLRARVVHMCAFFGEKQVVRKGTRLLQAFLKQEQQQATTSKSTTSTAQTVNISPDVRESLYQLIVYHSGVYGYELMYTRYFEDAVVNLREEQVRVLNSLGYVQDETLLREALHFSMSSHVRTEDAVSVMLAVATNPIGTHICWEFVKSRWDEIVEKFEGAFCLARLVSIFGQFNTSVMAQEYSAFFKRNRAPTAERAVKQTIERIESNVKWLQRDEKSVAKFLSK